GWSALGVFFFKIFFFHRILFALRIRTPAKIIIGQMSDQLSERPDFRLRAWPQTVKLLGHLYRRAREEFPIHAVGIAQPSREVLGRRLLPSLRRQRKRQ